MMYSGRVRGSWRRALLPIVIGVIGLIGACSDSDGTGQGAGASSSSGQQVCTPASTETCSCAGGESGMRLCNPDGTGYFECYCSGGSTASTSASTSTTTTGTGGNGAGGGGGGQIGNAPEVFIDHPSDFETRMVNTDIPFIGSAADVEDGDLVPVWASDLDGVLGTGDMITAQLATVGAHQITLRATDSDGNETVESITLNLE